MAIQKEDRKAAMVVDQMGGRHRRKAGRWRRLLKNPRKRGGRKPIHRLTEVNVTVDAQDLAKLDGLAMELGRSRSDLIRKANRRTWLGS